jgi:hypothetical protein
MARKPAKSLSPDDQAKYDQLPPQLKQIVDQNTNMASKSAQIQQLYALVSQGTGTNTQIGGGSAAPTFAPGATQTYTDRFESAIGLEGGRRVDIKTGATVPGTITRIGAGAATPMEELRGTPSAGFVPRYYERDADLITRFNRDQIADIQAQLNRSGLLGSKYRIGTVDDATRKAWVELLGEANRSNVDWKTALNIATASPIGGGQTKLPPKVSNPEDIKNVVNQVSAKILGRSADPALVDQIVRQFQASQVQSQTGLPMAGGRRVEPMDLQVRAEKAIRKAAGPEAEAMRFAQFAERAFGSAGSGAGVPETSVP